MQIHDIEIGKDYEAKVGRGNNLHRVKVVQKRAALVTIEGKQALVQDPRPRARLVGVEIVAPDGGPFYKDGDERGNRFRLVNSMDIFRTWEAREEFYAHREGEKQKEEAQRDRVRAILNKQREEVVKLLEKMDLTTMKDEFISGGVALDLKTAKLLSILASIGYACLTDSEVSHDTRVTIGLARQLIQEDPWMDQVIFG